MALPDPLSVNPQVFTPFTQQLTEQAGSIAKDKANKRLTAQKALQEFSNIENTGWYKHDNEINSKIADLRNATSKIMQSGIDLSDTRNPAVQKHLSDIAAMQGDIKRDAKFSLQMKDEYAKDQQLLETSKASGIEFEPQGIANLAAYHDATIEERVNGKVKRPVLIPKEKPFDLDKDFKQAFNYSEEMQKFRVDTPSKDENGNPITITTFTEKIPKEETDKAAWARYYGSEMTRAKVDKSFEAIKDIDEATGKKFIYNENGEKVLLDGPLDWYKKVIGDKHIKKVSGSAIKQPSGKGYSINIGSGSTDVADITPHNETVGATLELSGQESNPEEAKATAKLLGLPEGQTNTVWGKGKDFAIHKSLGTFKIPVGVSKVIEVETNPDGKTMNIKSVNPNSVDNFTPKQTRRNEDTGEIWVFGEYDITKEPGVEGISSKPTTNVAFPLGKLNSTQRASLSGALGFKSIQDFEKVVMDGASDKKPVTKKKQSASKYGL